MLSAFDLFIWFPTPFARSSMLYFFLIFSNHLFAQTKSNAAPEAATQSALDLNPIEAIAQASIVVQLTLFILVALSVVCWAITFYKYKQFKLIKNSNEPFSDLFWKAKSLDDIFAKVSDYPKSSLAKIFKAGYLELRKMADSTLAEKENANHSPMLSGIDNLERAIKKEIDNEISSMESRLNLLATTGSTGPFIGLFGTVWGIMGAFQKIGATQMASLAIVAPGISEALIATAIGLAAAIPATVAYNYFLTEIKSQEVELSNFAADFLNIAKRNFFKGE